MLHFLGGIATGVWPGVAVLLFALDGDLEVFEVRGIVARAGMCLLWPLSLLRKR